VPLPRRLSTFRLESNMPRTKTSWRKGQSGNPRGRPRSGEELGATLRHMVDRKRFAKKLCELCYAGDVQAMRLLLSYTDGLDLARTEGPEGIQITVNYVQQNNRIEVTGPTPRAGSDNPAVETLQRRLLRPALGENRARDGSTDSSGTEG
jgi:hypothetical protein